MGVKAEKVVRMSLVVLENFLKCKALSEDIASSLIVDAISALEYEKWRDTELYDTIKRVKQAIDSTVKEVSNFDRDVQELDSKMLVDGPLHTSKFWLENYSNLEKSHIVKLKNILSSTGARRLWQSLAGISVKLQCSTRRAKLGFKKLMQRVM